MALSLDDLDHIIRLAHLDVDASKKERYLSQLRDVLSYMERLNALTLDGVPPTSHPHAQSTYLRDDVVRKTADLLLEANAPEWEAHAFVVPKILDE